MGFSKEPGREISKVLMDHVLISCTINIAYEIAKQISVRATRAVKWGKITRQKLFHRSHQDDRTCGLLHGVNNCLGGLGIENHRGAERNHFPDPDVFNDHFRKIQRAIDASADVAMLLKDMENRMETASQKEI